jgi:hypothetical protein
MSEPVPGFLIGQVVRVPVRVLDRAGKGVDPGTVVLKIRPPGGSLALPEVVKDAVGRYHVDVVANVAGLWRYRWEFAAPNAGAVEGEFSVQASKVI